MSNYPTVNYIGNKEKVASWIIDTLPIKEGTVLDLFCGGCSVSYELKNRGFNVISNDVLFSNYVLAKSIIENSFEKLLKEDFNCIETDIEKNNEIFNQLSFISNKVYFDYEVKELAKLVNISQLLTGYKKYMFLSLLRRAMIRKIPYSRMNVKWEEIQKFRDEEYSYKKYGRYRHYHNIPFEDHINLNLDEYNNAVIENSTKCVATQCDAINCIQQLDRKVDLIYMDPPYPSTMNKYDDFYGYFDKIFNEQIEIHLDLTNKNTFLDNFEKIIIEANKKAKYVAISLNNKCYPSVEILADRLKPYVQTSEIFKKEHVYKVTGKDNKHTNYEILLVCEMKGE